MHAGIEITEEVKASYVALTAASAKLKWMVAALNAERSKVVLYKVGDNASSEEDFVEAVNNTHKDATNSVWPAFGYCNTAVKTADGVSKTVTIMVQFRPDAASPKVKMPTATVSENMKELGKVTPKPIVNITDSVATKEAIFGSA